MTDKTGNGALVFANSPTLINPIVGTQSPGDNSTKGASTAYADAAAGAISHLVPANNLSDLASASIARTNLGLGTAATGTLGVGANDIVQLDAGAKLPAVDGSQLTGISSTGRLIAGTALVLNPYALSCSTTQAHGLGAVPVYIEWVWECLTANIGYSVGDNIMGTATTQQNGNVRFDATNLILVTSSVTVTFVNPSTFAAAGIIPADWKLSLTPYKLT